MQEKKGFLKKYCRTIGVFAVWGLLLVVSFGIGKEEPNAANIAICLAFLIILQFALGYKQDKAAIKSDLRRLELERQRREAMGEDAWNKDQMKKKEDEKNQKKVSRQAIILDLTLGFVYLGVLRLMDGGDPKWLKDAIPRVLWFWITFPVFAFWIVSFPKRKQEEKIFVWELLIIGAFVLFPFIPLFSVRTVGVYIVFILGWIFSVMAIGYMRQNRSQKNVCTVMTTAKVIGNIKSRVRPERTQADRIPVYTYQPVLEYFVKGEQKQVPCNDGQPSPLPLGGVYGIYYNPENPDEFQFSEHRTVTERFVGPVFLGIGIVLLAVAGGILVLA